ncbi:MAG: helix-turn-helix domain-containing protein [Thermoplasmata archaeon]|nr:helix-turn-helix domain-containing protein [Thermoplasmata archaeon]
MTPEGARDRSVQAVQSLLQKAGFFVTDTHSVRPTSFDLMARRDSTLLILKVLKNIDALDAPEADRLRELSKLFGAEALVVGQSSGATELAPGVVYYRYRIPILTEESLTEFLLEGVPPFLFSSPGGIFVRVDGGRLRELREAHNLSLGTLASVAGVSRRTIQLYEGGGGAEVDVVERLERFLQEPIAQAIHLFSAITGPTPGKAGPAADPGARAAGGSPTEEATPTKSPRRLAWTGDALRDGVFRQLDGMGWEVVVTVRCPFDAFTRGSPGGEQEFLLTGVGTLRSAQHRAEVLLGLARVAEGHAVFVVGESANRTTIEGVPLVTTKELSRHRGSEEFFELIEERESW